MTSEVMVGQLGTAGGNQSTETITKNFQLAAAEISALQALDVLQGTGTMATVAALGTIQADAAAIAVGFTLVTGADTAKGVKLPTAAAGKECMIKNSSASTLKVWPFLGDGINALSVDAAFVVAAQTCFTVTAYDATTWYSSPLLPS